MEHRRAGIRISTPEAAFEPALDKMLVESEGPFAAAKPAAEKKLPRPARKPFYWVLAADMRPAADAANFHKSRSIARNRPAPKKH
jgi:hypothetical protein